MVGAEVVVVVDVGVVVVVVVVAAAVVVVRQAGGGGRSGVWQRCCHRMASQSSLVAHANEACEEPRMEIEQHCIYT